MTETPEEMLGKLCELALKDDYLGALRMLKGALLDAEVRGLNRAWRVARDAGAIGVSDVIRDLMSRLSPVPTSDVAGGSRAC